MGLSLSVHFLGMCVQILGRATAVDPMNIDDQEQQNWQQRYHRTRDRRCSLESKRARAARARRRRPGARACSHALGPPRTPAHARPAMHVALHVSSIMDFKYHGFEQQ